MVHAGGRVHHNGSLQSHLTADFQQSMARHAEMDGGELAVTTHEREQSLAP